MMHEKTFRIITIMENGEQQIRKNRTQFESIKNSEIGRSTFMNSQLIKVLIVDDQETVLKGLKMRLALEEDMTVIGEAKDGFGALQMASSGQPDVIVMDVEMPKMDGISATKALHDIDPHVKVIMLSIHDDPGLRAQARAAGAYSYVEKRDGAINLIAEIRNAFNNKRS